MRWIRNDNGHDRPLIRKGLVQAGDTHAIARGDLCELTAVFEATLAFVKIDSDANFAGELAIANEDVVAGDRRGYREFMIPRDGDVFEAALAAGAALEMGTALYYSSPTAMATAGGNILGNVADDGHYPQKQGSLGSGDGSSDAGSFADIAEKDTVLFTFKKSRSYFAKIQT